ncbi:MAG TPA: hypothetical protein VMM77_07720 [Gemmatimonadaceae bacterium]|nr:hypothetical protein [Gemmatimonadaceae bacterium]
MGLHLCYELALDPATLESTVIARVAALREQALALPFGAVSDVVRLTEDDLAKRRPLRGLAFTQLEDVVQHSAASTRNELYCRQVGNSEDDGYAGEGEVPSSVRTLAIGFAVAPGRGCEPAAFGLTSLRYAEGAGERWWWHQCCKTQYASVVSDEHLLRCHGSLVALLDGAETAGFEVVVRDETGYWESREPRQLFDAVGRMNRLVARFAGTFTDAVRDAGADGRQVRGEIFEHPDFERLEMPE